MEKLFSISQAAKTVNMTTETLRYYDRIGLVHPSRTDTWSKYHYYSEKDIVRLHKSIPSVYKTMMTRLKQGEYIIQNPVFRSLLSIKFPKPIYKQFK